MKSKTFVTIALIVFVVTFVTILVAGLSSTVDGLPYWQVIIKSWQRV